jgi:hypothetical protein
MGLGNRNARHHDTEAMRRHAVNSEDYADFRTDQRVMTADGILGTVTAVEDGPHPGTEGYLVTLDNGLGGGLYRTSDLRDASTTTASTEHQASEDYPELGDILTRRPDIAQG